MPTNKIVLGIVGEMGAGKSTITEYIKQKYGAVSFRFSDMLTDIAKRLYLEPTRPNLQMISSMLRQTISQDIMSKVIMHDAQNATADIIIVEGIRRPSDITYLKELPNFKLIGLTADERIRYERVCLRSEKPDDQTKTWEEFQKEGLAEAELEIQNIKAEADFQIDNNGNKETLFAEAEKILSARV